MFFKFSALSLEIKSFSQSLEQFFLTVGQNNFGNKIPNFTNYNFIFLLQNHKDNHKNSMAGTTILLGLKKGDEVCVYAYTGTWLADFPMNHYTHWVGLLLKPSVEEEDMMMKEAEEKVNAGEMIL